MSAAFETSWMKTFGRLVDESPAAGAALGRHGFEGTVGFGLDDEKQPRAMLAIRGGAVAAAGAYDGSALVLDLRARETDWERWRAARFEPLTLGVALAAKRLQIFRGELASITEPPERACAFAAAIDLMRRVETAD